MINKYNGAKAEKIISNAQLPAGGYVVKVMGKPRIESYSWGDVLIIPIDVAEGEQTGFYKKQYDNNTNEDRKWKGTFRINIPDENNQYFESQKRSFNNMIYAFESSNNGFTFDWDEQKLNGKIVGMLFRNKEWEKDGKTGWFTEAGGVTDVQSIRENAYKPLADKPLKNGSSTTTNNNQSSDFTDVPLDDDLPF